MDNLPSSTENLKSDTSLHNSEDCKESDNVYSSTTTFEQCEEEDSELSEDNFDKTLTNEALQERIGQLRESMTMLRKQLKEERELWKKEVEEAIRLSISPKVCDCHSSRDLETPPLRNLSGDTYFSLSEYEQKLSFYQQALLQAQAEKRASLKRQIAISNYKRRLLEVENMCNLELLRVKQNVQVLQPLQMMVSEWNLNNVNESGILSTNTSLIRADSGDPINTDKSIISKEDFTKNIDGSLPPLEMLTSKFYTDMTNMFSKLSPAMTPQLTTTTLKLQTEDFTAQSQSTVWYSAPKLSQPNI